MVDYFNINGKYHHFLKKMRDNITQPTQADFVRWYKKYFKNNFNYFKNKYYLHLQKIERHKHFPKWFITTYFGSKLFSFIEENKYTEESILVLENHFGIWKTIDNNSFQSIHPPTPSLAIEYFFYKLERS